MNRHSTRNAFGVWQQTTDYTCGPSCLMVALNELLDFEISEANEMGIWKQVHPFCYHGSLPGYLAIYACKKGLEAEIYYCPSRIARMLRQVPRPLRWFYRFLLFVNRCASFRAALKGIEIHRLQDAENDLRLVLNRVRADDSCRALSVIGVEDNELHYILLRTCEDQNVGLMDPAYGTNSILSCRDFVANYGLAHLGFHVLLRRAR